MADDDWPGGAFLAPSFSYQKMRLSALGLPTPLVYVPLLSARASRRHVRPGGEVRQHIIRCQKICDRDRAKWHELLSNRLRLVRDARLAIASEQADQPYADLLVSEATRQFETALQMIAVARDLIPPDGPPLPTAGAAAPNVEDVPTNDEQGGQDMDIDDADTDAANLMQVRASSAGLLAVERHRRRRPSRALRAWISAGLRSPYASGDQVLEERSADRARTLLDMRAGKRRHAMKMASFNSSGWPQMQGFLDQMRRTQVVGWQAFVSDAQLSDDGKTLGGVGFSVRRHINAAPLQAFAAAHELIPGLSVVMLIQSGIRGGLIVGSTRLQQGPRLSGFNVDHLRTIGERLSFYATPLAIAGDWDAPPEVLQIPDFPLRLRAAAVASEDGTYKGPATAGHSTLDYCFASDFLAATMPTPSRVCGPPPRQRYPICTEIGPRPRSQRLCRLVKPHLLPPKPKEKPLDGDGQGDEPNFLSRGVTSANWIRATILSRASGKRSTIMSASSTWPPACATAL
ncbi:unnamed protein product, partial [Prorocentrum cordatum]